MICQRLKIYLISCSDEAVRTNIMRSFAEERGLTPFP